MGSSNFHHILSSFQQSKQLNLTPLYFIPFHSTLFHQSKHRSLILARFEFQKVKQACVLCLYEIGHRQQIKPIFDIFYGLTSSCSSEIFVIFSLKPNPARKFFLVGLRVSFKCCFCFAVQGGTFPLIIQSFTYYVCIWLVCYCLACYSQMLFAISFLTYSGFNNVQFLGLSVLKSLESMFQDMPL